MAKEPEKKTERGVMVKKTYNMNSPAAMSQMASVLKDHIVKQELYTPIAGKNYAHVEGWQFAGGMLGLFPRVVAVTDLSKDLSGGVREVKWMAEVEVVEIKTGDVVSRGYAICSNKESRKSSFDEYAVLSMAQTRAIGKAFRSCIGWVMKLAQKGKIDLEGTPAEEIVEERAAERRTVRYDVPNRKKTPDELLDDVIDGKEGKDIS